MTSSMRGAFLRSTRGTYLNELSMWRYATRIHIDQISSKSVPWLPVISSRKHAACHPTNLSRHANVTRATVTHIHPKEPERTMIMHYSAEGAYDAAIEASAERILFVARDSHASNGYATDVETYNTEDFESCSIDNTDSCSSSGYSTSKSGDAEQIDIESEIEFLHEKQSLLKRAISAMKREDAYEASRAQKTVDGQFERKNSSLWNEAREIIDILNERDYIGVPVRDEKRKCEVAETTTTPVKRSRIDITSVICVSSGSPSGDKIIGNTPITVQKGAAQKIPFEFSGPWMGQAIAGSGPSLMHGWEVLQDPNLGQLIVPPSLQNVQNGVELREALALTPDARLVTLSAPPFRVVHANKAFCILSGLSSGDIIGKPIEALLQVSGDLDTNSLSLKARGASRYFLVLSNKNCQLQVLPVTDKFQNPRGGVSHVLVKVQVRDTTEVGVSNCISGTSLLSKDISVAGNRHQVFGAVG